MATLALAAVGMAIGSTITTPILGGISAAVLGRAAGAALGRLIDQRILGGSEPVEVGRVVRFRVMGASEGHAIPRVYGLERIGGQVIWASQFREHSEQITSGGLKGMGPKETHFSYTVSLAIALCEGEVTRIGRIWADGKEIDPNTLELRLYRGTNGQTPDPLLEAVEGVGQVPAYRGLAYVVIEEMALGAFGNRVPQFNFEIARPSQPGTPADEADLSDLVEAVALVPGTGEYGLATTPVYANEGFGKTRALNVNGTLAASDLIRSLDTLETALPRCRSVSLVVSWFGDDLRCGQCTIGPRIDQREIDVEAMPWRVCGLDRATAQQVPLDEAGAPVYGGTPTDQSVLEAIAETARRGIETVFYPFILMEQGRANGLPDPWGGTEQPTLPWRGRITLSTAPGQDGSPDQTAAADAEVAAFFGTAQPADFSWNGPEILYTGPDEFSYRRFILHYAHLCAAAGGVGAFCIGSEMRSLTQIRGEAGFPAVAALRALAADVRGILGPETKIGYAADWSEYHGYQPLGTGDKLFHLDALWADPNIDFIGIDNYMPLSDWRDGADHADVHWGSLYALDYLRANIEGGEGYDWYYPSQEARDAQRRMPITDGQDEPWIWRYKDLRNWWQHLHFDRINGTRAIEPSPWLPGSKPIWFTEIGCAAIDKGTNQPNKFLDPKSSESALPHYSTGARDELVQNQYIRALLGYYGQAENNPTHPETGVQMLDLSRAHVWAWDARPYPFFPGNSELWKDADNYPRGHWLNGRATHRSLASVVSEICRDAGLEDVDTRRLYGLVRGFHSNDVGSARTALQVLALAYGFDMVERDGRLIAISRGLGTPVPLDPERVVQVSPDTPPIQRRRAASAELAGEVRLIFADVDNDYAAAATEARFPDETTAAVSVSELPLALTGTEARAIAERWLTEARAARDTVRFALPPSMRSLSVGNTVTLENDHYRIDRMDSGLFQEIEASRIEPSLYGLRDLPVTLPRPKLVPAPVPVAGVLMDLPQISATETTPRLVFAATADPWPGPVAVYAAAQDEDYTFARRTDTPAIIGQTRNSLQAAAPGLLDRGPVLEVDLVRGAVESLPLDAVLRGGNLAAIGSGSGADWEVFQFAQATLLAPERYGISLRLRGQGGTDATMPQSWPAGSLVVLLSLGALPLELPQLAQNATHHFRFGPARQASHHPSYRHEAVTYDAVARRPYQPAHLKAISGSEPRVSWIRRTRIGGDQWEGIDVPVSEETEAYLIRVAQDGTVLRETTVTTPAFTYTQTMQAMDGVSGAVEISVAQLSASYGPGPFARTTVAL